MNSGKYFYRENPSESLPGILSKKCFRKLIQDSVKNSVPLPLISSIFDGLAELISKIILDAVGCWGNPCSNSKGDLSKGVRKKSMEKNLKKYFTEMPEEILNTLDEFLEVSLKKSLEKFQKELV